tara:strand:+ start:366 stop:2165 length:1800 start_codon:yes stop_codon:yes gene_type:complete
LKGFAVGFSPNSKNVLKRLKKTEFIDEIFIASSIDSNKNHDGSIEIIKINDFLVQNWNKVNLLIFIGSVGASVRLISRFVTSKDKDPGVLVIDSDCSRIIPLIGSHQSNMKNIAYQISNLIGGDVIDTSHNPNESNLNIDSFGYQWGWKRSGKTKDWSKLVILQAKKEKIHYEQNVGNELWRCLKASKKIYKFNQKIILDNSAKIFHIGFRLNKISWHPPVLWIGIGCERNTATEFIKKSLEDLFKRKELSLLSVAGLATIELKKDENGILEISKDKCWPIRFFNSQELSNVSVPNPSKIVLKEVGTKSVAEASAILAAGAGGKLILEKTVFKDKRFGSLTIAISQSLRQFAPSKGEIHIIGIGPGDLSFLTDDSKKALAKCNVWIGYKLYLDLIQDFKRDDQVRIDSDLTEERLRCEKAIKIAQEGIKVALISSGDAGIYGMGGLLLELLQNIQKNFRPFFEVHPGISSMQLAAALSGAPLMNDFCVISLSDKLNLWEDIEKRIKSALAGDFVVAIFNPQSQQRNWQLKRTIDLFLERRNGNTPVLIARKVGRENQTKKFYKLNNLPILEIDMFSILIIGNSKTKLVDDIFINPRGYL